MQRNMSLRKPLDGPFFKFYFCCLDGKLRTSERGRHGRVFVSQL